MRLPTSIAGFFPLTAILLAVFSTAADAGTPAEPGREYSEMDISRGQAVYKKSNCAFCHGWAGDGRGHPRSPAAAANLRLSELDKVAMAHVIQCGVAGGAMPYHDQLAYRDGRCGVDPNGFAPELLPQKGKYIKAGDLDALLIYIVSRIQGQGAVTFEQCEAYYKPGSRNCLYLQP